MQKWFVLMLFSLASVSYAKTITGKIDISVQGIMGPSFNELLTGYSAMLRQGPAKVDDVQIVAKNGYGKPLRGYISYSVQVSDSTQIQYVDYSLKPNCIWGDIFSQSQQYLNMIKIMGGTLVTFEPTSHNDYGKPCSAKIGYIK